MTPSRDPLNPAAKVQELASPWELVSSTRHRNSVVSVSTVFLIHDGMPLGIAPRETSCCLARRGYREWGRGAGRGGFRRPSRGACGEEELEEEALEGLQEGLQEGQVEENGKKTHLMP